MDIFLQDQFKDDLDRLPLAIQKQTDKTIRLLSMNPRHPSLETHQIRGTGKRNILEAKVNDGYRLLWEYIDGGIAAWRVGPHAIIDEANRINAHYQNDELYFVEQQTPETTIHRTDERTIFARISDNQLRLLGVPADYLEIVQKLTDKETIWELPLVENVLFTLYDVAERGELKLDDVFDPKRLLYRTTADQLAGYTEGEIKKLFLNLTDEQRKLVSYFPRGPLLIRGVAGSGKTTIGLYRAKKIIDHILEKPGLWTKDNGRSVLFVTYTETLTSALKEMFIELYGEIPELIHVRTMRDLMLEYVYPDLSPIKRHEKLVKDDTYVNIAFTLVRDAYPDANIFQRYHPRFFLEEIIDVIEALGLHDLESYQAVKRIGRGTGLNRKSERPYVWAIYEKYVEALRQSGVVTYGSLPRNALEAVKKHVICKHDAVIIDEAQDLTPMTIRFASRLLKDKNGRGFTLLADIAQSIYYRGVPWKEGGINITGSRSRSLSRNFRNTRPILEAASQILDPCENLKAKEEYVDPEVTKRKGPKPVVFSYTTVEEQTEFVVEEILRLCGTGQYRLGDIAILTRVRKHIEPLTRRFGKADMPFVHFRRNGFSILENAIKLITMHSAKGVEFPVVFLANLEEGVIPHKSQLQDPEGLEQERRLLYMSMTRACDRLYLMHPSQARSSFLHDLPTEYIQTTYS